MWAIIIVVMVAGMPPHPPAEWSEHYATAEECRNAIPMVRSQFQSVEGVTVGFRCARTERGA